MMFDIHCMTISIDHQSTYMVRHQSKNVSFGHNLVRNMTTHDFDLTLTWHLFLLRMNADENSKSNGNGNGKHTVHNQVLGQAEQQVIPTLFNIHSTFSSNPFALSPHDTAPPLTQLLACLTTYQAQRTPYNAWNMSFVDVQILVMGCCWWESGQWAVVCVLSPSHVICSIDPFHLTGLW